MVDLPEAREQLKPITPLIVRAHETAAGKWAMLVHDHSDLSHPLGRLSRLNFMHDYTVFEIEKLTAGRADVAPADGLGFYALAVTPNLLVRFKCVESGTPSNVSTEQQKKLARQEFTPTMLTSLTGESAFDEPPTLVTCGFTMEGTEIDRIEIRCDCKGRQTWRYDVHGGDEIVHPLVLDGMGEPATPATISTKDGKAADASKKAG